MDCKETEEKEAKDEKKANPAIILRFKKNLLKRFECTVCPCSYTQLPNLRYHIRRDHFNLIAKICNREKRKINEVWLENVNNSKDIVEIKKTGHNKYLMKKSNNSDCFEVMESSGTLDLAPLYPDCTRVKGTEVWCQVCQKNVLRSDYIKHLDEYHADLIL